VPRGHRGARRAARDADRGGEIALLPAPGARARGTTLVVSPLIALMEDQVAKLKAQGLAAERIHSGRERLASREVCRLYLQGKLDFLFIAPERLRVPGFPEMLAKRQLSLIAVDEAHCISNWGTTSARNTGCSGNACRLPPHAGHRDDGDGHALVQDDIVRQLALQNEERFIHGFRRSNIGVEVVEASVSERARIVKEALALRTRRPAIVYTPTRKEAEALAEELASIDSAAAYHAGLSAGDREAVQRRFLAGEISITVATIAFGMGIDKADIRTSSTRRCQAAWRRITRRSGAPAATACRAGRSCCTRTSTGRTAQLLPRSRLPGSRE